MTDKIGVLGEQTATTVGTHTAYTCPAGKSAKIKIMWRALMANTATLVITVNGVDILNPAAAGGAEHWFSSPVAMYEEQGTPTNPPDGITDATTVAPGPYEYYLSAGDTVTYSVGVVNITSIKVMVVGAELDAE